MLPAWKQRSVSFTHDQEDLSLPITKHLPWDKGKLIGPKPSLRPKHVWAIRTKLQIDRQVRDLALFNLAIDSKLRGCDLVAIKVDDVAPNGYAADRATECVRERPGGPLGPYSLSQPDRPSMTTSRPKARSLDNSCSAVDVPVGE